MRLPAAILLIVGFCGSAVSLILSEETDHGNWVYSQNRWYPIQTYKRSSQLDKRMICTQTGDQCKYAYKGLKGHFKEVPGWCQCPATQDCKIDQLNDANGFIQYTCRNKAQPVSSKKMMRSSYEAS